jgi:hypothetical protein
LSFSLRSTRLVGPLLVVLCAAPLRVAFAQAGQSAPPPAWDRIAWPTFAGGPHHNAISAVAAQPLNRIRWQAPVDLDPPYSGGELFIHYGSPLVTPGNNVVVPVKIHLWDDFVVRVLRGSDGALLWNIKTDYSVPSSSWVPLCEPTMTPARNLVIPAGGGTVLFCSDPDTLPHVVKRKAFYGLGNYLAHPTIYNTKIKINTPIVCDDEGNLFFGFLALGTTPVGLQSGIARLGANGVNTWTSAGRAARDPHIVQVVDNCAPAVSRDGSMIYVGLRTGNGAGYLVGLDRGTLAPRRRVRLVDPLNLTDALLDDQGTATPCVGPDGDVYYGVLENPFGSNHARGWMLHFDATLTVSKTPGDFGWDDTASIVPVDAVPSYTGTSPYLLFTKYNNYAIGGGNGVNKIAVLDPNATQVDAKTGATVMLEVLTIAGPTPDPPNGPKAVKEWCINDCAIDPITKCALAGSEDGTLYRWDFTTNTLSEKIVLTAGLGEAYTPTVVGVDGTVYAINNATLFAVGR